MTMLDPLGLREFSYEVRVSMDPTGQAPDGYAYRMRIVRGGLLEYESPWAALLAGTAEDAGAEARERTVHVMMLVQGGTVESLEPRG